MNRTVAPPAVPLVPPLLRRRLWTLVVPALVAFGALCWKLADLSGPSRIDAALDPRLIYRFGGERPLFGHVVRLGAPTSVAVAACALAAGCLALRARRAALLSLIGPPVAGTLAEYVLKPLIDRRHDGGLAFPSGHTTGACAVAVVLALLLLPDGALSVRLPGPVRAALWCVTGIYGAGVGLAVVVLRYHYATDAVGGAAVAVTIVLTLAWTVDRSADRWAAYASTTQR
jgi:membrane-associated phospholipid phosphatase